jgi:hypothetical protein
VGDHIQPIYCAIKPIYLEDLGYVITSDGDDKEDIFEAKLWLIGQINKVLYNFRKVNCQTKTRLVKAYCTSFYGAELRDLSQYNA